MELKIMQSQVQSAGTITAFNYAYCRILHDQAIEHLKMDIIDDNGNIFCLNEQAVDNLKVLLVERDLAYESFDNSHASDEGKMAHKFIINKTRFSVKNDSPLAIIFDQLDEQINDRWDINNVRALDDANSNFVNETLTYLKKVNNFLAMFEDE